VKYKPEGGDYAHVANEGGAGTVEVSSTTRVYIHYWPGVLPTDRVRSDDGTATGGGDTTLTDTSKSWGSGEWTGGTVQITSGTGAGQVREISGNTATAVTVTEAWETNPDNASQYHLEGPNTGRYEDYGYIWVYCKRPYEYCEPPAKCRKLWVLDCNLESIRGGTPGNANDPASPNNGDGSVQDRDAYDYSDDDHVLAVLYNDDDDDEDDEQTPDREQAGPVTNEDDLAPLRFQFAADLLDPQERDKTLYVEGYEISAQAHDAVIELEYELDYKLAVDTVRYTVVQVEFAVPDDYDDETGLPAAGAGALPTAFVAVSDPRPSVFLGEVSSGDAVISGNSVTLTLNPVVRDPIADNVTRGTVGEGLADIESVQVYVDGEESGGARSLIAEADGEPSFWRQHPYKGTVAQPVSVEIPLEEGMHVVRIETSENAAGNTGYAEAAVTLGRRHVPGWDRPDPRTLALWHLDEGGFGLVPPTSAFTTDGDTDGLWAMESGGLGFTPAGGAFASDDDTALLWHLEEADGAEDSSSNDNDGTLQGSPSTQQAGKFASCVLFDGADDYIEAPDDASLELGEGDFTIEAWVRADAVDGQRVVLGKWHGGKEYLLKIQDGALTACLSTDGAQTTTFTGSSQIATGEWTHVAACRLGGQVTLYVNGQVDGGGAFGGSLHAGEAPFRVGVADAAGGGFFDGKIDEVRVSTVARYTPSVVADASSDHNDGAAVGQAHMVSGGAFAKCLALDGSGDYVEVADDASLELGAGDFTIEAWIMPDRVTGDDQVVLAKWDGGNEYLLKIHDGAVVFIVSTDGTGATHTTLNGQADIVYEGKIGRGLDLDGGGDYVEADDDDTLELGSGNFTIAAWIRPESVTGARPIVGKWDGGNEYLLKVSDGKLALVVSTDGTSATHTTITGDSDVPVSEWTHIAAVRDGNTVTLYLDGDSDGSGTFSGTVYSGAAPLRIGAVHPTNGPFFTGMIDEVRIAAAALAPASTLYARVHMPADPSPEVADTIRYFHGLREPDDEDPELTEEEGQEDSLVFAGTVDGVATALAIDPESFGGLTAGIDTFDASITYTIGSEVTVLTATFTETSQESSLFTAELDVTRDGLGCPFVCWTKKVEAGTRTGMGPFEPTTIRIKGLGDIETDDLAIRLNDSDEDIYLDHKDDGYVYILGPSRATGYIIAEGEGAEQARNFYGFVKRDGYVAKLGPVPVAEGQNEVEAINAHLRKKKSLLVVTGAEKINVVQVDIRSPLGSRSAKSPYRDGSWVREDNCFDFQAVIHSAPRPGGKSGLPWELEIEGNIGSGLGYKWELEGYGDGAPQGAAGTLQPDPPTTLTPTHVPPEQPLPSAPTTFAEGLLTLQAMRAGNPVGGKQGIAGCGKPIKTVVQPGAGPANLGDLQRGDIIVYWGVVSGPEGKTRILEHSQTVLVEFEGVWHAYGANNEPVEGGIGGDDKESWRWNHSVAGAWASHSAFKPTTIEVYRRGGQ